MKEHILTYLLKDSEWWSGVNITNTAPKPTSVLLEYYSGTTGQCVKSEEIPLNFRRQARFPVDVPYGWARAVSDDDTYLTVIIGNQKSSMLCPVETRPFVLGNFVQPNKNKILISNGLHIEDCCTCKYFSTEMLETLKWIGRALYYKFPDRRDARISVIDGAPFDYSDCPGHPPGTHQDGMTADFHYFTLGPNNHTQTVPPITSIWTDGQLNSMFDTQRNMGFVLLLAHAFQGQIIMDERIKNKLVTAAWETYGAAARDTVTVFVQGDTPESYNHHLHGHFRYTAINFQGGL